MRLTLIIDDKTSWIEVPQDVLEDGETFFQKMDHDMDGGWRMGPEFIESPNQTQRCQIAANKLLVSMSTVNKTVAELMAGYILKRLRGVTGVRIDTGGEMLNTEFLFENSPPATMPPSGQGQNKDQNALTPSEQAAKDISQVYKVGKGFRFAAYDHQRGQWIESPLIPNEQEAQKARAHVYQQRLNELLGSLH